MPFVPAAGHKRVLKSVLGEAHWRLFRAPIRISRPESILEA